MMDAFTTSDMYPYARHYRLGDDAGQLPAQQREGGGRRLRRHASRFYVFDPDDPDHRRVPRPVPGAVHGRRRDAGATCARTCAIRSCCSRCRPRSFSLYHMRDPEVFYNREDLWSVASEVTLSEDREQVTRPLEPNFVLMKLPGEADGRVRRDPAVHARRTGTT